MDKEDVIERLSVLKADMRSVCFADCCKQLPIEITKMLEKIRPYSILERAFDKAIDEVKKRSY